jgi:hypothetical protein
VTPATGQEDDMKNLHWLVLTTSLVLVAVARATPAPQAATTTKSDEAPVMAVWVQKEINFPYRGLTAYYSCDGLRLRVMSILKEIGARPGFKVDVRMCPNYPRPEVMPWVYITAALPQPATPELLAELAKPDSKQELVSRVQGKDAPAQEATAQFPAKWQRIAIRGTQTGPVQLGDCELVDEMAEMVFVQLGARIVENQMACVPKQVTPGSIRLTLEVMQPVPQQ